jgi:hypothetical protein
VNSRITASGEVTGNGSGQGSGVAKRAYGFTLSAGTGAAAITQLRDGTGASASVTYTAKTIQDDSHSFAFPRHLKFDSGIYVSLTGTGAELALWWDGA